MMATGMLLYMHEYQQDHMKKVDGSAHIAVARTAMKNLGIFAKIGDTVIKLVQTV